MTQNTKSYHLRGGLHMAKCPCGLWDIRVSDVGAHMDNRLAWRYIAQATEATDLLTDLCCSWVC